MTHVSVIVPLYNAENYIGPCVESVLSQTFPDWELIIVDDGSTDASATIAADFAQRDPRIRLLRHTNGANRGVSITRRRAMQESKGEFVALLDADDLYAPDKLQSQVSAAQSHPECVVYHCGTIGIDAAGTQVRGKSLVDSFNAFATSSRQYEFRKAPDFLAKNSVLNSSAMIRSEVLSNLPFGFPQLFQYEDWTLWVLLSGYGPFFVQSEKMVKYRIHEASATSRVLQSELVAVYSYIEFLCSTIALSDDAAVCQRASKLLATQIAVAVDKYGQFSGAESAGVRIEFDSGDLANATPRKKKKWYRKLLRRAA